ncbi:MAG: oligosaccharide flippase family protein [Chloroflexi bacterium]|nr:oligosaccharide flippase family protein [Chloroflexota bacterium]
MEQNKDSTNMPETLPGTMHERGKYSRLLTRNALFNLARYGVSLVVMLLITPFILHKIGVSLYGVWALILVFSSAPLMLDLGVGAALNKFIPEFYAKGALDSLNRSVNVAIYLYGALGFLIVLILLALNPWIISTFMKPSPEQFGEIRLVFILSLVVFLFNFILAPYITIITGLQRFDLFGYLGIFETLGRALMIFIFLNAGWGLIGLVIAYMGGTLITLMTGRFIIKRILPGFSLIIPSWEMLKGTGKDLITFGAKIFVTSVAVILQLQLDKLLLGYFLNTTAVSFYQLGNGLARQFRSIPDQILSPIFPAASEMDSRNDFTRIKELYFRSQKYNMLFLFPFFTLGFIMAPALVRLWLGEGFELSALTCRFYLAAFLISLIFSPGFHILNGMGRPDIGMKSSILLAIANIILSPILIWKIGFTGALWGTTTAMVISTIYFVFLFHKTIDISFKDVIRKCFIIPAAATVVSSSLFFILPGFFSENILTWLCFIIVFLAIYLMIMLSTGHLDKFEKDFIKSIFSSVKGKILKKKTSVPGK